MFRSVFTTLRLFIASFSIFLCAAAACAETQQWPEFEHVVYTYPAKSIQVGEIAFTDCRVSNPSGVHFRVMQCGSLVVPEDYNNPQSRQIRLFVGRLPASGKNSGTQPFLPVSGGPGSAASELYIFQGQGLDDVARQHDIYIIDQRGTGKSHKFDCKIDESRLWSFDKKDDAELQKDLQRCIDVFDGDPRFYTTSVAVRDLESVRKALTVEQWNLYGVSYGTRVAQHYLRRHPTALRTVTLDGVVPAEQALGVEIAAQSQRALDDMIGRCEQDVMCKRHFPGLRKGIYDLFGQLKTARDLSFDSFKTGQPDSMSLHYDHLAALTRLLLYSSDSSAVLPLLFSQAYAHDNYAPLARNVRQTMDQVEGMMAFGMHNSVVCTEDAPFFSPTPDQLKEAKASYIGSSLLDQLKTVCEIWPQGRLDDEFKEPVKSDNPVLLMSGGADPITPPDYAEQVARHLTNALHIVVPELGHSVVNKGCMPVILAKFVSEAKVSALQTDCVNKIRPQPFFIDFNGPSP